MKDIFYTIVILLIGVVVLDKLIDVLYRKLYHLPNGVYGLPIIGVVLKWKRSYLLHLAKYYKHLCLVPIGQSYFLLINDLKLSKKLLNKPEFMGHSYKLSPIPKLQTITDITEYSNTYQKRRKNLHKSMVTSLNCSYLTKTGNNLFEKYLFEKLDQIAINKESYLLHNDIKYCAFTLIFKSIFGESNYIKQPSFDDIKWKQFAQSIWSHTVIHGKDYSYKIMLGINNSILYPTFIEPYYYKKSMAEIQKSYDIILEYFNEYEMNYNYKNCQNNNEKDIYVQYAIKQINASNISKEECILDILSIFQGGLYATYHKLLRAIKWLVKLPKLQHRIYNELKLFVEKHNGEFCLSKIYETHIFRAFIHESLRYRMGHDIIPRIVTKNNVFVEDYYVPKNCIVFPNYFYFNHSKEYWKYPLEFNVNNFLDESNKFVKNKAFSAFGHGARNCMGEALAKRQLYLIIGSLILRYIIGNDNNDDFKMYNVFEKGKDFKKIKFVLEKRL
eukprot:556004_1